MSPLGGDQPTQRTRRQFVVGRAADVPPGTSRLVTAGGHDIAVFNVAGEFFALLNRCPHRGGPLCRGRVVSGVRSAGPGDFQFEPDSKFVACPWHGWEFDLRTGQSYFDKRKMRARSYKIDVQEAASAASGGGGQANVAREVGPYRADVVSIEDDESYLVVTLR